MSVGQGSGRGLAEYLCSRFLMTGQLSCQPELWAHVKAHLEGEGFASSFAHVVIERSRPLTTGLPHNMEARPPKVTWSKRVKQRERDR